MTRIHNRPLLIYDGDCGFCGRCVDWLAVWSRDKIGYSPYQKELQHYPDVPESFFRRTVVLDEFGQLSFGAHAIFKTMYLSGKWRWIYRLYQVFIPFRWLTEWVYLRVAKNRGFFSRFFKTSCRI